MLNQDLSPHLQEQVRQAIAQRTALCIVGGNSKTFYGTQTTATTPLDIKGHSGILSYEPSELVITARAGTLLSDIENVLAQQQQILGFEPPYFTPQATLGGTLACGFSGPRRPFAGSARDFVLGCRIINGLGENLHFGGQVIKNVAGFDVSRLMVGALGQLGVLLDVSLRVLPKPESEITLYHTVHDANQAIKLMQTWQGQAWPLSGLSFVDNELRLRLSGAKTALQTAAQHLGGDKDENGAAFWYALKEQQLAFFQGNEALWRISLPPATPMLALSGHWLLDWGGALRWLKSSEPASRIHALVQAQGGHAICFKTSDSQTNKTDWLHLDPTLLALQQKIRLAFDPYQLFNPQRLLPTIHHGSDD